MYYGINTTEYFLIHVIILICYSYLFIPSLSIHLKCTLLAQSYIIAKAVNINTRVLHQNGKRITNQKFVNLKKVYF